MTREEAISEIKSWAFIEGKKAEAIHTLIPELAETEDEHVRKWLIALLQNNYKGNYWATQAIAYLEKQKPIYNLEIPAGDVAPAEEVGPFDEDEFLEGELSAFLQNYDKTYDDAAVFDVARHFYEIGKKQKEQKPIEPIDPLGKLTKIK